MPLDSNNSWNNSNRNYCLSGRLRQCFDHIVRQVYKVAFSDASTIAGHGALSTIVVALLQQINSVIFHKIGQYLKISELNPVIAAQERDEFISVSKFASDGEEPADDKNQIMVDQHHSEPGQKAGDVRKAINKIEEARKKLAI